MDELVKDAVSGVSVDPIQLLVQLSLAFVIGSLIALHPMEWKKIFSKPKKLKIAQSQILLCVAGALLINVIGDSAARAFGIFGIGSFVRFRAPVKSPMDAAKMFMLLGLGMAIGMDLYVGALVSAAFLYVVIFLLGMLKVKPLGEGAKDDSADLAEE